MVYRGLERGREWWGNGLLWGCALFLLVRGWGIRQAVAESVYIPLDPPTRERLPLAPHALTLHARPTPEMLAEGGKSALRFLLLDKRTLRVQRLEVALGERWPGPWGGVLLARAFVPDLLIREGVALHGPEGHVNPAAWLELEDGQGHKLHEGWAFVRDNAQIAWDHPRFDLTFLGVVPPPLAPTKEERSPPKKRSSSRER